MSLFSLLSSDWQEALKAYCNFTELQALSDFLSDEYAQCEVFPPYDLLFRAFSLTPFAAVKAVILGQDPYHQPGQACGLAFSVNDGIKFPPSLKNILQEYCTDLSLPYPESGSLDKWASEGVLMLNAVLSVRNSSPESHKNKGWESFTDAVIKAISEQKDALVFILWGNNARQKKKLLDLNKHAVIESAHPSPLSAYRGFFDSKPFSKTNQELKKRNVAGIDWELGIG